MVELGSEHRTGVCKVQVLFFAIFCYFLLRMLMSFREERRGPVGVAGLRMGQARLQGLLMDCPVCPSGNPGMSCNGSESPREKTDVPQAEKAEPASPTVWAMALQDEWAVGPNPC